MAFIKGAGYNAFDVFGLLTNSRWTEDIVSTISNERKGLVKQVIDIVHRHDLKLIYGLGVYSWGFDDIIAQNPQVRGTSSQAMCASSQEAKSVMFRVVDYIVENFEIDGFHLEAADQGRCTCGQCKKYNDVDYFNRINILVATYIRKRWPEKILLVNTSGYLAWGDTFTNEQLQSLVSLCNQIDVFIDVGSHGFFVDKADRRAFSASVGASFGTANGFWIYPPQRWNRLRWFIPHMQQNYETITEVFADGGDSSELYLSPLVNPGVELTVLCNGLTLQNPLRPFEDILQEGILRLYGDLSEEDRVHLQRIFRSAEDLFFSSYRPERNRTLDEQYSDGVENIFIWSADHPEAAKPGELFLERLFGIGPGYPCYLTVHFDAKGRNAYLEGMMKLHEEISLLCNRNPKCDRLKRIEQSINATIGDLQMVIRDFG